MHRAGMLSIWFFIGVLLLMYGFVILGAGIYELANPAERAVASELRWIGVEYLHPSIWWGALLIVLGSIYSIRFRPRKGNDNE
ncbi:MAG: hypothetical protein LAQ30_24570 [Acidobacteriia bacterium]|nr:hypothetical protein [Terriglobia bacterium]